MSDVEPTELLAPESVLDPDRLEKVTTLIVSGATERQIRTVVEKQFPGAEAEPLIVAAMLGLAESGEADPLVVRGWCIEATKAIYRRALADGDLELALKSVNQLNRIARDK